LDELKNQVEKVFRTNSDKANERDVDIKRLTDGQVKITEDIGSKFKEISDRVSTINDECVLHEKSVDKITQGLEAFKKENQEAFSKLNREIESLSKKFSEQQKLIHNHKKSSDAQNKYVNDFVKASAKVISSNNSKKVKDLDVKLSQQIAESNKKYAKQENEMNIAIKNQLGALRAELEKQIDEIPAKRQRFDDDYTIILGKEEFKIHKSFLLAHCPKIASMVRENPQMESFELKEEEISVESFKEILNFMYLGVAPSPQSNLISLFAASCHLEINTLATIVAGMLKDKINSDNAFDILIYCNEYGKEELKMKAFEEFSKNFPKEKLKAEIASQPNVLAKLNATKMEVENILNSPKKEI
jgi:hypothetical protein